MPLLRSWLAWTFATTYVLIAAFVIQWEVRNTGGGFINLRALGTNAVTAPSQLILGPVFRAFGVPAIDIDDPKPSGYIQLGVHVLVTAAIVYALGWGVEWWVRRALSAIVATGRPSTAAVAASPSGSDTVRDKLEVGALFGLLAGVLAWVLVLIWSVASRFWRAPLIPMRTTVLLHLGYVLAYVALGALGGILWSTRTAFAGRLATCALMTAAGGLTVFSLSAGPAWRWPASLWARYALAVLLFALMFAWPDRTPNASRS